MALLNLPPEIVQGLLSHCDPLDLPSLNLSCRTIHGFIKENRFLHRDLYLRKWDAPSPPPLEAEPDWEGMVHETSMLERLLKTDSVDDKRRRLPAAAVAISHLLHAASSARDTSHNLSFLKAAFTQQSNIDALLCSSSLFSQGTTPTNLTADSRTTRSRARHHQQLSAKLHVLYGVPILPSGRQAMPTYPYARARIYDLRQYTAANFWGPFLNDGSARTDWEKLEAVMVDLGYNTDLFRQRAGGRIAPFTHEKPFDGASPGSFLSPPRPPPPPPADRARDDDEEDEPEPTEEQKRCAEARARDPYGVTGTWMRIVCFLDYRDFYNYNFRPARTPRPDEPRHPVHVDEAIRVIRMELYAQRMEHRDGEEWPVTHFSGRARSMHAGWDPNANSGIRGTVGMGPDGEVRWRSVSVFHGEERWAAEGIQIGGPCSARGVLGTWFDKDFDPEGPCGPTSFWKVSDDTQTRLSLTVSRPGGDESSDDEVDEDEDSVMLEAEEEDDSDSEGDGDFVPVVWV